MPHVNHCAGRYAVAAALGLALLLGPRIPVAVAFEHVRFETARFPTDPLQVHLERDRGERVEQPAAQVIDGFLMKPDGDGPFPAVVALHGCNGLSAGTRDRWTERAVAWGYAVLFVDSFTARSRIALRLNNSCPLKEWLNRNGFLSKYFRNSSSVAAERTRQGADWGALQLVIYSSMNHPHGLLTIRSAGHSMSCRIGILAGGRRYSQLQRVEPNS